MWWAGGRSAILESKENMSMIGNAAGGRWEMERFPVSSGEIMDICQNGGTSTVGSMRAFPELPTDKGRV